MYATCMNKWKCNLYLESKISNGPLKVDGGNDSTEDPMLELQREIVDEKLMRDARWRPRWEAPADSSYVGMIPV